MKFFYILALLIFIPSHAAQACKCPNTTEEQSRAVLDGAFFVGKVKVRSLELLGDNPYDTSIVELESVHSYKNDFRGSVTATVNGKGTCSYGLIAKDEIHEVIIQHTEHKKYHFGIKNACPHVSSIHWEELRKNAAQTQETLKAGSFPQKFSSKKELAKWAGTSTFGGGHIKNLDNPFGAALFVVYRMYTSGMLTSDIAVYVALKTGGYRLLYSHPGLYGKIIAEETENAVLFVHHSGEGKTTVLKEFTMADVLETTLCQTTADCRENSYCFVAGTNRQPPMCFPCPNHLDDNIPEDCR